MAISFWRRRDRYYRILGSKCKTCGSEYFPPVYKCRKCGTDQLDDYEMPKTGTILTYTILYEPIAGFEDQMPLILGIIRLENGVKIPGQIVDTPEEDLHMGAKVKVVFRRMKVNRMDGQIFYGYKFVQI